MTPPPVRSGRRSDAATRRYVRVGAANATGRARLKVVGCGAGPKLVATRRPFSLPETWAFNAPETLDGVLIQSNLKALFRMDAWRAARANINETVDSERRRRAGPWASASACF